MKSVKTIRRKATFLLIVFALNTIMAFACSIGLDMGYNSNSHSKDFKQQLLYTHGDGNKQVHPQETASHGKSVSHGHTANHHHNKSHAHADNKATKEQKGVKDNCCKERAREFQEIDKLIRGLSGVSYPAFFATFDAVYRMITLLPYTNVVRDLKPFVRNNHPPIPDIRIAIQSFQI